jgi:hypothetical protein
MWTVTSRSAWWGDVEHRLSVRRGDQCGLVPRECSAAPVVIERIADAQRYDLLLGEIRVLAENRPDFARLLAGEGGQHVEVERRARRRGFDFFVKLLLEPADIFGSRHRGSPLVRANLCNLPMGFGCIQILVVNWHKIDWSGSRMRCLQRLHRRRLTANRT